MNLSKTLWMGDVDDWMDEIFIKNICKGKIKVTFRLETKKCTNDKKQTHWAEIR